LLARIHTSVGRSIKDSFASLDMAADGFRALFAKEGVETSEPQTVRQSQLKRCSARAFCARSRIAKVREIGRSGAAGQRL
jgi:hypothetical protein